MGDNIQDHCKAVLEADTSRRVKVVSDQGDYIVCELDWSYAVRGGKSNNFGEGGKVTIYVAKPYYLRKTPFDGQTITYNFGDVTYVYSSNTARIATYATANERCGVGDHDEFIWPPYKADDYIWYTAIVPTPDQDILDTYAEGNSVRQAAYFIDENRDGRHWADDCGGGDCPNVGSVWV